MQFWKELLRIKIPNGVLVPKGMTGIINVDPSHQQSRGLTLVPIGHGNMTWVHPNIIEVDQ